MSYLKTALVLRLAGLGRADEERVIAAFLQLHHNVNEAGDGRL